VGTYNFTFYYTDVFQRHYECWKKRIVRQQLTEHKFTIGVNVNDDLRCRRPCSSINDNIN
jgi:hypothetical protein